MSSRALTKYETHLIGRLVERLPERDIYLRQIESARAEPWAGDESIKLTLPEGAPSVCLRTGMPAEGEFRDADGVVAHVLLHVQDGHLRVLEIFKEDGSSVAKMPELENFKVIAPNKLE
jgi:hypothetical protein